MKKKMYLYAVVDASKDTGYRLDLHLYDFFDDGPIIWEGDVEVPDLPDAEIVQKLAEHLEEQKEKIVEAAAANVRQIEQSIHALQRLEYIPAEPKTTRDLKAGAAYGGLLNKCEGCGQSFPYGDLAIAEDDRLVCRECDPRL